MLLAFLMVGFLFTPLAGAEQCQQHPMVCEQEYALCIAASCMYDASFSHALCVCEIESGWSVGPTSCNERKPVDQGKYTQYSSTFSTEFYSSKAFYQGSGTNADCYGATCFSTDGEQAVCLCDVSQDAKEYWTEAGSCSAPGQGNIIYSGAPTPFNGGRLDILAEMIATCSGESAPTPNSCN